MNTNTKLIPLTQGYEAIVDAADYERLAQWKWQILRQTDGVRARRSIVVNGKKLTVLMHRMIMNPTAGMVIDHINHNTLDNRRINLRICTQSENMRNRRGPQKGSSSQYLGVTWHKAISKWCAVIAINGTNKHIGSFACEIEAAKAYDAAARLHHGKFANPNFPTGD